MLVADEPRRRRRHVEVARQPDHWQLLGRHRRLRASKRRRRRRLMAPPSSAIDAGRLREGADGQAFTTVFHTA